MDSNKTLDRLMNRTKRNKSNKTKMRRWEETKRKREREKDVCSVRAYEIFDAFCPLPKKSKFSRIRSIAVHKKKEFAINSGLKQDSSGFKIVREAARRGSADRYLSNFEPNNQTIFGMNSVFDQQLLHTLLAWCKESGSKLFFSPRKFLLKNGQKERLDWKHSMAYKRTHKNNPEAFCINRFENQN